MERKPRSSFLKLLSEPSFDFTPYFDKAVIEWLERNMGDFLEERPEASAFFINEKEYRHFVAKHLPLTDDAQIISFLREFDGDYNSDAAFVHLAPRLVSLGKTDLLLHAVTTLRTLGGTAVEHVIDNLSDEGIRQLFGQLNLDPGGENAVRWADDARWAFIKRLPSDLLVQLDPFRWTVYYNKDIVPNTVSILAAKWPLEDIDNFLTKYGRVYTPLFCMHCGEKTLKSKPGYTLHRKTCDPNKQHPSIWVTIAERTK
jgi:hypothetical protein